ncbi:MAG: ATP-dependent DNA ligase, partial [Candidatus Heimdallarchaeaceae archaeon]
TPYTTDIESLYKRSKTEDWEGIMLKRKNSRYIPNRTELWLKLKNIKETVVEIYGLEDGKDALVTSKGNVGLRSSALKEEYLKKKPKYAEVMYLYETKSGKLFQPILKRFVG